MSTTTASTADAAQLSAAAPASEGIFYYGWVTVVLGALAMVATLPGRTHGLGLITEPLLKDLDIDRVTYGHINLWATLLGAVLCLPAGRLLDRFGTRITVSMTAMALGSVVWHMGSVASLWTLLVLVTLTRGFGQSALSVISISMVGKWFNRKLGLAMAIYSILIGLLFSVAFQTMGSTIKSHGWREAWSLLGAVVFGMGVLFLIFVRNSPVRAPVDEYGNGQSGSHPVATHHHSVPTTIDMRLSEALRTSAFWVFALATSMYGLVTAGLGLFNQAVLAERGFDFDVYYRMQKYGFLASLCSQLLCMWLAQRMPTSRLISLAMLFYAAGLIGLTRVGTLGHLMFTVCLMGAAGGIIMVVFFAIWRKAFGVKHLGHIQGAAQLMTVLASAVGPLLFSYCEKWTGSYSPMFYVLAPIVTLLGLAAWRVGDRPQAAAATT